MNGTVLKPLSSKGTTSMLRDSQSPPYCLYDLKGHVLVWRKMSTPSVWAVVTPHTQAQRGFSLHHGLSTSSHTQQQPGQGLLCLHSETFKHLAYHIVPGTLQLVSLEISPLRLWLAVFSQSGGLQEGENVAFRKPTWGVACSLYHPELRWGREVYSKQTLINTLLFDRQKTGQDYPSAAM